MTRLYNTKPRAESLCALWLKVLPFGTVCFISGAVPVSWCVVTQLGFSANRQKELVSDGCWFRLPNTVQVCMAPTDSWGGFLTGSSVFISKIIGFCSVFSRRQCSVLSRVSSVRFINISRPTDTENVDLYYHFLHLFCFQVQYLMVEVAKSTFSRYSILWH